MSDKDEFGKARDEYLEHIRVGKQDETTALQLSQWAKSYFKAEIEKRDKVIGELMETLKEDLNEVEDNDPEILDCYFSRSQIALTKAKEMLK